MALELTPEQKLAIEEYGKNIIVSAGAGSGKTFVLTERVLYFIKNKGFRLSDFLILTFTNLAAGEMKERIRKKLSDNNLPDASLVDTSDICTFDSYALSIVKKYHFLLNVSPNISIVDSNIIAVRKRTIINEVFEELYKTKDEAFLRLIDEFCFMDDDDIRNLVFKFYNHSLNELDTNYYLDSFIDNYYKDDIYNEALNIYTEKLTAYKVILKKLIIDLPNVPLTKKNPETYYEKVVSLLDDYFNAESYDDLINTISDKLDVTAPRGLSDDDKEKIKRFKKDYTLLVDFKNSIPVNSIDFTNNLKSTLEFSKTIINIVKEVDNRIKSYKTKYQIFEFNDIAKLALQLVRESIEVRNSLKMGLKMIMIDEYQDTSVLQEAFINLIENNNVYMVGDVKQSIYRFRNARCDIFIDKYNKYKYEGKGLAIDLNKNFRSRNEVLDDINYIFKNLMTKDYGGASYVDDHLIECGNTDFDTLGKVNENCHSDFIIHNTKNQDAVKTEATLIAKDIINKINNHYQVFDGKNLRDVKFSDFCILMDRGEAFEEYYQIFSKHQIPLFIDNDENIKNTQIVKILFSLLKIVKAINIKKYTKEFKKAFVTVARSFLYNYKDEEIFQICKNNTFFETDIFQSIKESLFNNSSLPLALKIENLIFDLDIYNLCIKSGNVIKNEKYLDIFINLFKDMTKLDYDLDDFIDYLENVNTYNLKIVLSSTGSTIDSVKLMNIHKSKGLEFKIVYFSGLYKNINQQEYKNEFGISTKYGLFYKPAKKEKENILKVLNKQYELKEQISEAIRLFYVALTRTKEKMIFVINSNEFDNLYDDLNEYNFYLFINKHNLSVLKNKEKYEVIVKALLNKEINIDVFYKLNMMYNFELNDEIKTLLNNNIEDICFDDFLNNTIIPLNEMIDFNKCTFSNKILQITTLYKLNNITLDDYLNVINLLDYEIEIDYLNNLIVDNIDLSKLLKNPKFIYINNLDKVFISKLLNVYSSIETILKYYKIYFNYYPYHEKLYQSIFDYNDKLIGKEDLINKVKYLGYDILVNIGEFINVEDVIYNKFFIANSNMKALLNYKTEENDRSFKFDENIKLIYKYYENNLISIEEFKYLINLFGFSFSVDFNRTKELNNIYKTVVDHNSYKLDYENMLSFKSFMLPFINSYLFKNRIIDLNTNNIKLINTNIKIENEKLIINEITTNNEIIKKFNASKKIDLNSSKKNMEFGTKIHFLLEVIDFKNPSYDFINDEYLKNIVKDFIESPLLLKIKNARIYKEYEFFDKKFNVIGIIDLMIIYDDYIDIIDYKTNNIDDEAYINQLSFYEHFINEQFNKKVNTYLYSLQNRTYKKIN